MPDPSDRPTRDAGAQPERTGLAWQRTALSGLACSLVVAKLVSVQSSVIGVLLAGSALITTAVVFAVSRRRHRRATTALTGTGSLPDGKLNAAAVALIVITALGAAAYTLLHSSPAP